MRATTVAQTMLTALLVLVGGLLGRRRSAVAADPWASVTDRL